MTDDPTYDQGEIALLQGVFADPVAGAPVVPATVLFVAYCLPTKQTVRYTAGLDSQFTSPTPGTYVAALDTTSMYGRVRWRIYAPPGTGQSSAWAEIYITRDELV